MTDCCCCLPLLDRSHLCSWIADPYHTVGWSTVREHGCLCSVHKVEHNFIRVHAYHTVREGLMSSNRRGKRQHSRGCIAKEEHLLFRDQSLCIVSTIQLMDNPVTRRKTFGMDMWSWPFAFAAHFRMPETAFSGAFNNFGRCNNSIYSICNFSAQENLSRSCQFDCNSCISWDKSKIITSGASSSLLLSSDSSLQGN